MKCWGDNTYGQLGNGTNTSSTKPVTVSSFAATSSSSGVVFEKSAPVAISAGHAHACALLANGKVECWGDNTYGELGTGSPALSDIPLMVPGLSNVKAVAAGYDFNCAVLADGTAKCWGFNDKGQLGNGTTQDASSPVTVSNLTGVKAIAAGDNFACALTADGNISCWGANGRGELGNGTKTDSHVPLSVSSLYGIKAISINADGLFACAVQSASGQFAYCWGAGTRGQLGNDTTADSSTPVEALMGMDSPAAISAGATHACALALNGDMTCWGDNTYGEIGYGPASSTPEAAPDPVYQPYGYDAASISLGNDFSCSTFEAQTWCWGSNGDGQLGLGNLSTGPVVPTQATGSANATAMSAGSDFVCTLAVWSGHIQCWGNNDSGQLGNGTTTGSSHAVNVSNAAVSLAVSATTSWKSGDSHTFQVIAIDACGKVATGYKGKLHFTSSDAKAVLPADYSFTSGDAGKHTFSVAAILKTAGTQSITATDTAHSTITGSQTGITVGAGAATHFSVSTYAAWNAGDSHSVTVRAYDANGNVATGYTGTIKFTSSDAKAVLPANYAFTSGDAGKHTFSLAAILKTAGTQSITATDAASSSITGSQGGIVVSPAAATHLSVSTYTTWAAGATHSVTVKALDAYGNVATGYGGTIKFTSSDPKAVLPGNYTFTSSDAGTHAFSLAVTLKTPGTQSITVTDTVHSTITGSQTGIAVS